MYTNINCHKFYQIHVFVIHFIPDRQIHVHIDENTQKDRQIKKNIKTTTSTCFPKIRYKRW